MRVVVPLVSTNGLPTVSKNEAYASGSVVEGLNNNLKIDFNGRIENGFLGRKRTSCDI